MMTLIVGGSGSGKSAYAERYIGELSAGCQKYYIATMQVYDEEGRRKIERHRQMRRGKGFCTIEQPVSIEEALLKMEGAEGGGKAAAALLECMSNLTANEMFSQEAPKSQDQVAEKILRGIESLKAGLAHLVIVTNNVFEDGIVYDETTMEYIRAMGAVNERLAAMADRVVEVVVGIPLTVKEEI